MSLKEFALLFNKIDSFRGTVRFDEPLSKHTTINVGGNAEIFIEPEDEQSLVFAVSQCAAAGLRFFVLGGGSNVIISDSGIKAVVSTRKMRGVSFGQSGGKKTAVFDAGISWAKALSLCREKELGGLERFTGLSGTVGGAIFMNATCFALSVSDVLVRAKYLDTDDLKVKMYEFNPVDWSYKKSFFNGGKKLFPPEKIILSGEFSLTESFDSALSAEILQKRKAMGHFNAPSAGSAFKNVPEKNIVAGKIIDECGLKGFSVGNARIAPWHGNFFINPSKNASAGDFAGLRDFVQKTVYERTGIMLESEIIFVG